MSGYAATPASCLLRVAFLRGATGWARAEAHDVDVDIDACVAYAPLILAPHPGPSRWPLRPCVQSILKAVDPFRLPSLGSFRGMDIVTMGTSIGVVSSMLWAQFVFTEPQITTLTEVQAAICAGDQYFLYALDGLGSISWGYAPSYDPTQDDISDNWLHVDDEITGFYEEVITQILAGNGRVDCPAELCYNLSFAYPVPFTTGLAECCIPHQSKVPHLVGGVFSLSAKASETPESASDLWNPSCSDTIQYIAFYANLLQASMSAVLSHQAGPCGGHCAELGQICKQLRPENRSAAHPHCVPSPLVFCPSYDTGYSCQGVHCDDAAPFCADSSPAGLRARQICPQTCGCDQPQSPLALFLPGNGCPRNCVRSTTFRTALATVPCEDLPRNSSTFLTFLDQWHSSTQGWPNDWKLSGEVTIDLFRRFGCDYLNMNGLPAGYELPASQPLFWPANFGVGRNPCVANGNGSPIKPLSYFCPVSCGCRAGDAGCPDTCPARWEGVGNSLSQIPYAGQDPNPSPWNVPDFPWRYSHLQNASRCVGIGHCDEEDH